MRLDLTSQFTDLAQDVGALKRLAHIAEEIGEATLVATKLEVLPSAAKAHGYHPILMTDDQFRAFHSLIGHIGDVARRADDRLGALEVAARGYVEAPRCA